ncbi:MAG: hypothetical protein FJ150_03215 [Euryarchaeota archaeon]|nr:hypothetical protein [Euryarchaeota archaeon]
MKKNTLTSLGIITILVFVVALSGCTTQQQNQNISAKGTKLAIYNNGTTWAHVDLVMENVTFKNGSVGTIYAEAFMKPVNGSVTIDLSQLLGYGDEKLPPGTQIRILSWKGLFNNTTGVGGTAALDITFQGWSNTLLPESADQKYPVTFAPLPIAQLPANITDNIVYIHFSAAEAAIYDNDTDEPLFEEELLTVDQNGRVTITFVQTPILCTLMTHPA